LSVLAPALAILAAYLLGSISFAVVVSRIMGLADPRSYGSGNPGATNVLRSGSKAAALLTLLGDALKGVVAIWLVRQFGAPFGLGEGTAALAGLAAFVGHLYPVFLRFQGGKGVATFLGAVLALQPVLGLMACATWLLVAGFFRYASLASLSAAVVAAMAAALLHGFDVRLLVLGVMTLLLILRHQQNIENLIAGKERKLGAKESKAR
jgi:acyl phosphate:glycerol-3-phosphate acyltransferase